MANDKGGVNPRAASQGSFERIQEIGASMSSKGKRGAGKHVGRKHIAEAADRVCFFVYGTLKEGYRNQHWWPTKPLRVDRAWTYGHLYDLGDFPAMVAGADRVLGELWTFHASHFDQIVTALDELEGTNLVSEQDWYERVSQAVFCGEPVCGETEGQFDVPVRGVAATCYLYLRELNEHQRVTPDLRICQSDFCVWTR